MTEHLSQKQIDRWLIGDRTAEVESHLNCCQVCAAEIGRMNESLALFGSAVRSWGEQQMGTPRVSDFRAPAFAWGRIGLAFAALSLVVAMPMLHHRPAARQLNAVVSPAIDDERLLEQIQTEISQSVPSTMEPIAKLMPKDLSR